MSPSPAPNVWLPFRRPLDAPRLRLFAMPFAGGGASVFRQWPAELPTDVELAAVQLPGRETRFKEHGYLRMSDLVRDLTDVLTPELDRPFALFGHSMGALVAFELARELRRRGLPKPELLIVAGHAAPHRPAREPALHALPDPEFLAQLRRLNGTPEAVLENEELLQAFMPTLRADFTLCENYTCSDEAPLDVPIAACGGFRDPRANYDDLDAWRIHTRAGFSLRLFTGDHFFLQSHRGELLSYLSEQLNNLAPKSSADWPTESTVPALSEGEVHVWKIELDENVDKLSRLERLLSPDERARAERFHFRPDRARFIVGRGVLRLLLGAYLQVEPERVSLWYNLQGKPGLNRASDDLDLRFNVAHSAATALMVFGIGHDLGIDIEQIRPDVECLELAERYFSRREIDALRALPETEQRRGFFAGWSRKEAYLKGHGIGLSLPLDQFSVSMDGPPRLLSTEHDPAQQDRWELHTLDAGPEFAAALAIAARGMHVTCRKWIGAEIE